MLRLWIAAVVAGCTWPGVRGAVGDARDAVVAQFRAEHPAAKVERIDYLGQGCYVVDDRTLYACTTDEAPAGKLTCREDYWFHSLNELFVTERKLLEPWPEVVYPPVEVQRAVRCERVWSSMHPPQPTAVEPVSRSIDHS